MSFTLYSPLGEAWLGTSSVFILYLVKNLDAMILFQTPLRHLSVRMTCCLAKARIQYSEMYTPFSVWSDIKPAVLTRTVKKQSLWPVYSRKVGQNINPCWNMNGRSTPALWYYVFLSCLIRQVHFQQEHHSDQMTQCHNIWWYLDVSVYVTFPLPIYPSCLI